ncbi:hypothetical protein K4F52_002791 [Lecanicillium sp. MT-2017a]|nr:hypothetical protein K4F52_002791 [Lecanicillium sp. MT-2017a]
MPQYRIEISPNNRAKCKDSVCQKEAVKLLKGEIRFGTWVEIEERGSWAWKHWGCVSGQQMERLHDACKKGDDDYDFDEIDGYDEITDADVKKKIERCVRQAHIDPEDFNGDPEKNVPGATGIRLTAAQKRAKEKPAADGDDDAPSKKTKKRARRVADDDESDDDAPITKTTKKAKTASKSKSKSKVKDEEDEEPPAKTKKTATKAKAPAKKAARKSAVKDEDSEEEEEGEEKPKAKSRRGRARASKA